MRRLVSVLLCIAIVASLCCTCAFAANGSMDNFVQTKTYTDGMFTDVTAADWFAADVASAYSYNLMVGQSQTLFGSKANITIGEVVALASKIHCTYYGVTIDFGNPTPWYKNYITYAINNNIIELSDYSDYTVEATREQMAKIIYKALPNEALPAINAIKTGEIPDVSANAVSDYLYTLYRAGIISGRNAAGRFYPAEKIMRCEVAAIAARMANKSLRVTFTIDPTKDTIEGNQGLGNVEGSGNIATKENLLTTVNNTRQSVLACDKAVDTAFAHYNFSPVANSTAIVLKYLESAKDYAQAAATMAKEAALYCKDNADYASSYTPLFNVYSAGAAFPDAVAVVVLDVTGKSSSTPKQEEQHWQTLMDLTKLMQTNATQAYNNIAGIQK